VGKQLNLAANQCALAVKALCHVAPASHAVQIDDLALVEAFPTAFLGVMIADPTSLSSERSNRSDVFFQHLAGAGRLASLLEDLLPGRTSAEDWRAVTNHDDRAALVCALTSLCVAAGGYVAVGDQDGWIVLPPVSAIQEWALRDLEANSRDEIASCIHYA
jgi:hypothetical protein